MSRIRNIAVVVLILSGFAGAYLLGAHQAKERTPELKVRADFEKSGKFVEVYSYYDSVGGAHVLHGMWVMYDAEGIEKARSWYDHGLFVRGTVSE